MTGDIVERVQGALSAYNAAHPDGATHVYLGIKEQAELTDWWNANRDAFGLVYRPLQTPERMCGVLLIRVKLTSELRIGGPVGMLPPPAKARDV